MDAPPIRPVLVFLTIIGHSPVCSALYAENPETIPGNSRTLELTFNENFSIDTSAKTGSIAFRIGNKRNTEGIIGIALFNSGNGFPDKPDKALAKATIEAEESYRALVIENIPYGTYALSVLHDENRNGKMDKTWIGKPKEGFGASNNPKITFGPPEFDESYFIVNSETVSMTIDMNYF